MDICDRFQAPVTLSHGNEAVYPFNSRLDGLTEPVWKFSRNKTVLPPSGKSASEKREAKKKKIHRNKEVQTDVSK